LILKKFFIHTKKNSFEKRKLKKEKISLEATKKNAENFHLKTKKAK